MDLSGKVALVTGAGRGIGRGCAIELAAANARLVINDRIADADLADTAAAIQRLGQGAGATPGMRTCVSIGSDVFTRAGCEQLVTEAIRQVGQLDILVSNPAFGVRRPFLEYDPEDFERVVAATLTSGFHMCQLMARHLVERGCGGKIVLISSVQAEMPLAHSAAYNAAKAGLNHLAQTIAVELAPYRIHVNVIEPGWIDTPGEHLAFGTEMIRREGPKLPWGRLGTPADIGRAAAFLASDAADYITGAILPVDGGFRFKDCRPATG